VEVQAGNVHKHQCSEYGAEGGEWRRIDRPKEAGGHLHVQEFLDIRTRNS
jgi:hypothetical protein